MKIIARRQRQRHETSLFEKGVTSESILWELKFDELYVKDQIDETLINPPSLNHHYSLCLSAEICLQKEK